MASWMKGAALILTLTGILSVHTERYRYGNGLWPRRKSSGVSDVTILMRTDLGFLHAGNITSWSIYTNGTGNITFQIWRPLADNPKSLSLVGTNNFTMEGSGLFTFEVFENQIEIRAGDFIGIYTEDSSILTYSVPESACPSTTFYMAALSPRVGQEYTFEDADSDLCRSYPIQAEVEIMQTTTTTIEETTTSDYEDLVTSSDIQPEAGHIQTSAPETRPPEVDGAEAEQTEPSDDVSPSESRSNMVVTLLNGRQPNEGVVLVRANASLPWATICDEGWNDKAAGVVCRMARYTGGAAKYYPYFGRLGRRYDRLHSLTCTGTEASLAECRGWQDRKTTKCHLGEDAAVECFTQSNDLHHVFGYPAVSRSHIDEQDGPQIVIPHPHHTLPWTSGTVRQWTFYLATDVTNMSNVSLQIWRRFDAKQYTFVGETPIRELPRGFHVHKLMTNEDRIHFEAGDVIGIRVDGINPISFDVHPGPCEADETMDIAHLTSTVSLLPGQPYTFQNQPTTGEGCRIYSLFASYVGSERFGSHIFSIGHSLYKIVLSSASSWEDSGIACMRELGDRSSLVNIDDEAEYSSIVGMLNSMDISEDLWIGTAVASTTGEGYRKWAQCHPKKGQHCTYLGRPAVDEYYGYSSDVFYMFTDSCETQKYFLCEKTPYKIVLHGDIMTSRTSLNPVDPSPDLIHHNITLAQPRQPNIIISHKVDNRGPPSILVAPVTTAVLLFTCLAVFIIIHLYRRQKRKHSRDDEVSESTVRFISLYDKAALNSMDC